MKLQINIENPITPSGHEGRAKIDKGRLIVAPILALDGRFKASSMTPRTWDAMTSEHFQEYIEDGYKFLTAAPVDSQVNVRRQERQRIAGMLEKFNADNFTGDRVMLMDHLADQVRKML